MATITVHLPMHLCTLARIPGHETQVEVAEPTVRAVLDALEAKHPTLEGTIRDHVTRERRAFLRFFACEQDISHESVDAPLPAEVVSGREPLIVLGAVAGG
jgi:molybdopterin synthase sulfur carrier subunit